MSKKQSTNPKKEKKRPSVDIETSRFLTSGELILHHTFVRRVKEAYQFVRDKVTYKLTDGQAEHLFERFVAGRHIVPSHCIGSAPGIQCYRVDTPGKIRLYLDE